MRLKSPTTAPSLVLDIVAVFTSTPEQGRRFVARKPRPFAVIAHPTSSAHEAYGIEGSFWPKWKGVVTPIPTLLKACASSGWLASTPPS